MEEVFEEFVTAAFRRYQRRFSVHAQRPMRHLADAAGSVRAMMQFRARRRVTGRREDARRAEVSPALEHRPGVTALGT